MSEGISLAQALGQMPAGPPPQPKAQSKEALSLAEAMGQKAPAPGQATKPGFTIPGGKKAWNTAQDFWSEIWTDARQQQEAGISLMKEGKGMMAQDRQPFIAMGGLGETMLGAGQWLFSGANAALDAGYNHLIKPMYDDLGDIATRVLPERTNSTFGVTGEEVKRNLDHLTDFTNIYLQSVIGGIGATKELPKTALALMPEEERAAFLERGKQDPKKVENAFEDLMIHDPSAARHVEKSMTTFSPEMQKLFDAKWAKFVKASETELNKVGIEGAKLRLAEIEAKLPTNIADLAEKKAPPKKALTKKPLTKKPEAPVKASDASKSVPPPTPAERNATSVAALLKGRKSEAIAKAISKSIEKNSKAPSLGTFLRGTNKLHLANEEFLDQMMSSGKGSTAHEVLDIFIENSDGPLQGILKSLRKVVPNIKIYVKDEIEGIDPRNGAASKASGVYSSGSNTIEVSRVLHNQGYNTAQTLVHELAHAASVRLTALAEVVPNLTPHYKELERLLNIARERAKGMYLEKGVEYGLSNIDEFIAETFANPRFQRFLMSSEAAAKPGENLRTIFHNIVDQIAKMLGLKSEEATLFHNVMDTSSKLMQHQFDNREAISRVYVQEGHAPNIPSEFDFISREPKTEVMKGKIETFWEGLLKNLAPESLSKEGKLAGAYIARAVAGLAHDDSVWVHKSFDRKLFWARNKDRASEFYSNFLKGKAQPTQQLQNIAKAYEDWASRTNAQDLAAGVKQYEGIEHFIPQLFDDPREAERVLNNNFGGAWRKSGSSATDPAKYLNVLSKAGLHPKFDNIEDLFLLRQHSSDLAGAKLEIFRDLAANGIAIERKEGSRPPGPKWDSRASPDGKSYWVHPDANAILTNAFDSKSLWTIKGIPGGVFRAGMALKNTLIPVKLALSLFHPLHIATIHNATEITRASTSMLSGTENPVTWFKRAVLGSVPLIHSVIDTPGGHRLLRAFKGQVSNLTLSDMANLKRMQEGGFIPEISAQYKTRAIEKFRLALAEHSLTAAWHLPFAAMQLIQKPIFEHWIPSLKISSYLKDTLEWEKRNPSFTEQERIQAFRRISKSVDNRYGEMAYNTLFWKRYVKDIAVADTLSLGWNLGFVREYGGGLLDAGQAIKGGTRAAKSGLLDRPLFVSIYTTQALAYGGLLTWAMTGESPKTFMDYVFPRTGENNTDGTPKRAQTMFFTREFGSIYKHVQNEGALSGISDAVWNKGSGLMSLAQEGWTGTTQWGEQYRDGNASFVKQTEQTLGYFLKEFEPISLSAIHGPIGLNAETARSVAGFAPAGKYITQTRTQGRIDALYNKTYAPRESPFDKAQYSQETRKLKEYWETDQMDKFDETYEKLQNDYNLTGAQMAQIRKSVQKGEDPTFKKFESFSEGDQKALLDQMSEEEREKYWKHTKKKVRREYEAPVE